MRVEDYKNRPLGLNKGWTKQLNRSNLFKLIEVKTTVIVGEITVPQVRFLFSICGSICLIQFLWLECVCSEEFFLFLNPSELCRYIWWTTKFCYLYPFGSTRDYNDTISDMEEERNYEKMSVDDLKNEVKKAKEIKAPEASIVLYPSIDAKNSKIVKFNQVCTLFIKKLTIYMKKVRVSDWLRTSTFFMLHELKVETRVRCKLQIEHTCCQNFLCLDFL